MRFAIMILALALLVPAGVSRADVGTPQPVPKPARPAIDDHPGEEEDTQDPRQQAERYYRDASDEVARGNKDLAAGNSRSAEDEFRRALQRGRDAVTLDSTYAEAWNLVGFTSRMLGDYPGSLTACRAALRQKPDFAPAHEDLGEGLLESGDPAGAGEQLEALRRIGDTALVAQLQVAIDRWHAAHPDSTTAGPSAR